MAGTGAFVVVDKLEVIAYRLSKRVHCMSVGSLLLNSSRCTIVMLLLQALITPPRLALLLQQISVE